MTVLGLGRKGQHALRRNRARHLIALATGLLAASPLTAGCGGSEPAATAPVEKTYTTTLQPFTDDGEPAAGLRVIQSVSARCIPSALTPGNDRARRCFTNETSVAMDPCFLPERPVVERDPDNEMARELGAQNVALCVSSPEQSDVTKVYVLQDSGPAPWDTVLGEAYWSLELADGTRCLRTRDVPETRAGLELSYGCDDGGYLYGAPDETQRVWTIHRRAEDSEELTLAEIRTAWS
ncbi:hypothetical protein [Saccharomonospora glauca]|uniref:Uncharacterized protein n=1 Tax=Saccharomonospora glauca K62 TaxID=928724 RepID=I1D708_9PSEU|nr:hypothetical protein [Saccharomonospora glauca]EIF00733.1 hypothetical protein SacglDRAFT_03887 [Saccharomonospora glauca K62]